MIIEDLKKFGFDEKEAQLYLCLLELGESNLAQISKKSNIKRTTCYDIIESLKKRGLIAVITKKKRAYYIAEDPRKMGQYLDEKKHLLAGMLPQLLSVTNLIDKKPKIRYFEGIEGIKDVYRDTLNYPRQETLAWVSDDAVSYFDINWLWNFYVLRRVDNKIWQRSIAPDVPSLRNVKTYDQKHLRQTRLISPKDFPFQVEINLYGGTNIGIMSFQEKIGLIIESKKIYTTLKSIFEAHWKSLEI